MKQYLLIVNDECKAHLEKIFKVEFLEVQGLYMDNSNKVQVLVTPVAPPVTESHESVQDLPTPDTSDMPADG